MIAWRNTNAKPAPSNYRDGSTTVEITSQAGRHKTYALAVMEAIRVLTELEQNTKERKVMPLMRAKLEVNDVQPWAGGGDGINVSMCAVTSKPFDSKGENEDNTYAKYTPSASLKMSINNPALIGKIRKGQQFYVDFTGVDA